jgi:hypothetical protein
VDETKTYPVIGYSTTYTVNAIPTASVTLAVGREANMLTSSVIEVQNLGGRLPVRLYLRLDTSTKMTFRGYIASVSPLKQSGRIGVSVSCVHWMDDLIATSALASTRTPRAHFDIQNPMPFTFDKVGLGFERLNMIQVSDAMSEDLREEGDLYNILYQASNNIAEGSEFGPTGSPDTLQNTPGLAALAKFRGFLVLASNDLLEERSFSSSLTDEMMSTFSSTYNGGTMGGVWTSMASSFRFVIVPTPDAVFVFPSCRAIKSDRILTLLRGDDYVAQQSGRITKSAVRAVALVGGTSAPMCNLDSSWVEAKRAFFSSSRQGIIDTVRGPRWLVDAAGKDVDQTFKIEKGVTGRGAPKPVEDFAGVASKMNEKKTERENIGVAWARAVYLDRLLGGNSAVLKTPMAYDILPGTCIGIRSPDAVYQAEELVEQVLYGYVRSVTMSVDAVASNCSRDIALSHLHGEDDDEDVAGDHPLFLDGLPMGGELVPGAVAFSIQSTGAGSALTALTVAEAAGTGYIPTTSLTYDPATKLLMLGTPSGSFQTAMAAAAPTFGSTAPDPFTLSASTTNFRLGPI